MSKLDSVSLQILNLRVPFSVAPSPSASTSATPDKADEHVEKAARKSPAVEDEILALDLLLEVHLKGEGKKYNPNANYDFLASVFANISLVSVVSAIRSVPRETDDFSKRISSLKVEHSFLLHPTLPSSLPSPNSSPSLSIPHRFEEVV